MSERTRNIAYLAVIVALVGVVGFLVATNPTESDRVEHLGSIIMCPVCQGEAIISSPSQMAREMMDLIRERVSEGGTDQQIIDELTASYGQGILLDPPVTGPTLILWLAPAVALVAGIGVILWWRRHPGAPDGGETTPGPSRARVAVGALILIGSAAAVLVAVTSFLQQRDDTASGLADIQVENLDEVSNQTLEAVIAANADHPQISGMRLALADRYREEGNYRAAFPHYLAVAESEDAPSGQKVAALAGLAWITWDGNGEVDTAIGLLDRALELQPGSVAVRFLQGRILRCAGRMDQSAGVLEALLSGDLSDEWRQAVADELQAVGAREACA